MRKHSLVRVPSRLVVSAALLASLSLSAEANGRQQPPGSPPLVTKEQGNFYVAGVHNASGRKVGQMYVEYQIPPNAKTTPIIMIHGFGQIGAGFDQTPDGRDGWRQFFLRQGYKVYVVDQPARGRSPYDSDMGPISNALASGTAQQLFAAPERYPQNWPAAKLHTQWVGPAIDGDPTYEQFLASQSDGSVKAQEDLTVTAMIALLKKIGPAIIISHSQPGPFMYRVVDQQPKLVKALVLLEPGPGPLTTQIPGFGTGPAPAPTWGITDEPITYYPPVTDPAQLGLVPKKVTDDPYVKECWAQSEPAHKLINLTKTPIMLVTSEAGYNTMWDPCTYRYFTQAGVYPDWVRLPNYGIHGNSHFMYIERNSDQVAALVNKWISSRVKDHGGPHS